ncbi:mucin-5AC [Thrips palmi]|uniref:Mucin-5AC n=1 Tax=Thrips palmi TaxID=161013 RepID=A0A6P8ZC96_THRPL|nr:mucin-5AC [Thrips palmi]
MNQCDVQWIHLDPLHANRFDDGVAVNGCSDYSSSSSSGHSDITDPGSPFSVSSEDSSAAPSPARTTPAAPTPAPAAPALKQDPQSAGGGVGVGATVGGGSWAWAGESELVQAVAVAVSPPPEAQPAAPTTASKCNVKRNLDGLEGLEGRRSPVNINSNNNLLSNKKLKVEPAPATTTTTALCVQTSTTPPFLETKKECFVKTEDATEGNGVQQTFEPDHRGKITHYYKPKKKPDEKRIPLVKAVTMGFTPFMPIIANKGSLHKIPPTPPDKSGQVIKSEPLSRKMMDIKVNSIFKCPAAFDVKKVSNGLLMSSKLPDVVPNETVQAKLDPDDKKLISMPSLFKSGSEKIKSELSLITSAVLPVALCSRLDEKWTTCSESPSSPKSSQTPAVASTPPFTPVPSEIPTVVSVSTPTKPVSNTTPIDRTVSSQSCLSIREQCNVKESRPGVTTDVVEKVSESVVPEAVISSNGQAEPVSDQLTVNTATTTTTTSSFLIPAPVGPKSPILSVPKSIRFPARSATKPQAEPQVDEVVSCLWTDCTLRFNCDSSLLEHLQGEHVNPQKTDSFVCHWVGCKVFGRSSCSRSWLERHVLSHGGNKPFRCIVDGCGMRFSSQLMLERHVNWHFKQSESPSSNGSAPRRSLDTPPNRLIKRCGKKLRYRRQPWSARQFDYFDSGIMEGLQYQLVVQAETMDLDRMPGSNVTLYSKIMAQRVQPDGSLSVLLRWFPRNCVEDEWVLKRDVRSTRTVRLTEYPESVESLSSAGGSVYSSPPSSPISVISASSTAEFEDEAPTTSTSNFWVLKAPAAMAKSVADSKPLQSRKSRRKPIKKAAVT